MLSLRKMLAAGQGTLSHGSDELVLTTSRIVDASVAEPLVPPAAAHRWRRLRIRLVLQLNAATATAPSAFSVVGL